MPIKVEAHGTTPEVGDSTRADALKKTSDEAFERQAAIPEELVDEFYGKGCKVFDHRVGKLVPYDTYLPPAPWELRESRGGEIFEKKCRACGCVLSLSEFSPSRTGRGGVKAKCKACCAEYAQEYGRTAAGKAARARARAKYEAQERDQKDRIAAIERMAQDPLRRALMSPSLLKQVPVRFSEVKNG